MADSINGALETTPLIDFMRDIISEDRKLAADGGQLPATSPDQLRRHPGAPAG